MNHNFQAIIETYASEVGFFFTGLAPGFFITLCFLAARSAALESEGPAPGRFRVAPLPFPAAAWAPDSTGIEGIG